MEGTELVPLNAKPCILLGWLANSCPYLVSQFGTNPMIAIVDDDIRDRVMSGIARARAAGNDGQTPRRRRHPAKIKAVRAMRAKGAGVRKIAAEVGLGVGTVLRLVATGA